MQFLKILFWCLLAFVAALFTYGNWTSVPIKLWSGLIADVNLPMLLLATFLLGFVPTTLYHQAIRWRLRQRIAGHERLLAERIVPAPQHYAPGVEQAAVPLHSPSAHTITPDVA